MTITHVLYLHGFRSSPQSTKARLVAHYIACRHPQVTLWCPQLPASPRLAMERVLQGLGVCRTWSVDSVLEERRSQKWAAAVDLQPTISKSDRLLTPWRGRRMAVIGSSLGGFYASWVAQQCRCPSVLLNPAVDPARDLARHLGQQTQWHDPQQTFDFHPQYITELQALDCRAQPPAGAELLIAAQGDEVLDWREMLARYPQAQQLVLPGSDHALSDFAQQLPRVWEFLDLA